MNEGTSGGRSLAYFIVTHLAKCEKQTMHISDKQEIA